MSEVIERDGKVYDLGQARDLYLYLSAIMASGGFRSIVLSRLEKLYEFAKNKEGGNKKYWNMEIIQRRLRVGYLDAKKIYDAFSLELLNPDDEAQGKIAALEDKAERLKSELMGVFRYYHFTYKNHKWDMCCSSAGIGCGCGGMPTDPEYYIWRDLEETRKLLGVTEKDLDL